VAALVAAAMLATPAGASAVVAPPQPNAPADGAGLRRDAPITFTAQNPSDPAGSVYVNVAATASVDANGVLDGQILDLLNLFDGPPTYTSYPRGYVSETDYLSVLGTYYWQVDRYDCDYPDCIAHGPVHSFTIIPASEHITPIPASAGHQVDADHLHAFRLYPGSLPDGVDLDRFQTIAVRSAARWGIGFGGRTDAKPHDPSDVPDGVSSVGFSPEIQPGPLGLASIYQQRTYKPGKRICRRRHGRRVCHRGPRQFAGLKVVDEDIELDPYQLWQAGPRYPNMDQFDLESVLLHEFGHFAGNAHAPDCSNTPMVATQAPEDWWHAADDFYVDLCGEATPAARLGSAALPDFGAITRIVPDGWRPPTR
jgi:hypothetical protein